MPLGVCQRCRCLSAAAWPLGPLSASWRPHPHFDAHFEAFEQLHAPMPTWESKYQSWSRFSDSGSQDDIDLWEQLEAGARPPGGEERQERPRKVIQNVGRCRGAPRVSEIIIQTRCKRPQAMLIDPDRLFLKKLIFKECVVFEGLRSGNLL